MTETARERPGGRSKIEPEADGASEADPVPAPDPAPALEAADGIGPEPEPEPELETDPGPGVEPNLEPGVGPDVAPASATDTALDGGPVEADGGATPAEPDPAHRRRARTQADLQRSRRLLAGGLVVLVVVGTALALVGVDMVWNSTAGHYVSGGLRPDEPGYVALVEPTPTLLVASIDEEEGLVGVAILSLHSRDEGGSVVVMPVATRRAGVIDVGDAEDLTLGDVHASLGSEGLTDEVEQLFEVAIAETVELDAAAWASFLAPVEPLELVLPDAVGSDWAAGPLELAAEDAGEFLRAANEGESELNRTARHELFWQAWIPAVTAVGDAAVPGEPDAGVGRFIRGLSRGSFDVTSVPMVVAPESGDEQEVLEADSEQIAAIVAREIPFPREPEAGVRIRVRLLNGTTEPGLGLRATTWLVEAGAEMALTGNAESFDEERTRLVYTDESRRAAAVTLRNALGVGTLEHESGLDDGRQEIDADERIDVTVILGADAPGAIRRLETTG